MSIAGKLVSVPTTTTGYLSDCAKVSAVDSMGWSDDPASRLHQQVAALLSTYQSVWSCYCCWQGNISEL